MLLMLDDLEVLFPFDFIYPEQLQYMRALKSSLGKGHALLEMPTGTGKTITLLSLLLSYQYKYPEVGKIVYCTRTVHEMNKVLAELENLQSFREQVIGQRQVQFAQQHPQLTQLAIELLNNIGIQAEVQAEEERKLKSEVASLKPTSTAASNANSMGIDEALPPSLVQDRSIPTSTTLTTTTRKNPFKRIYTTIIPSENQAISGTIQISKVSADQPIKTEETTAHLSSSSALSKLTAQPTPSPQPPTNIKIEPGTIGFDYNIIDDPNTIVKKEESTLSAFNLQRMQHNSAQQRQQSILTGPGIRSYIVQKTVETLINQHGIEQSLAYEAVQILRKPTILGLSLSARTNMCIHPEVGQYQHREKVDTLCRAKTAASVREQVLKSIVQRSTGGKFKPSNSMLTDEELTASLTSSAAISGYGLDLGFQYMAQNMGMSDDSIPPPLDDMQSMSDDIPTAQPKPTITPTPPCEIGTPCQNCPSTSTSATQQPSSTTNASPTINGHVVTADIEDIQASGLCPYFEGFLSHTNNRSSGYSNLQLAQSSNSTNTPYADSIRIAINNPSNPQQQQQQQQRQTQSQPESLIPTQGVFDINSLINIGRELSACPYYLARHLIAHSNIVVYNYHYMLDPKVNAVVDKDLEPESIIVFDEAHNIDNICIEALSITISKNDVYQATRALERLRELVHSTEQENQQKLIDEYNTILSQLQLSASTSSASSTAASSSSTPSSRRNQRQSSTELAELVSSPVIPQDMLTQAIPATIRRARGFLLFLKSLLEFLKEELLSLSERAPHNAAQSNTPISTSSTSTHTHTGRDQYYTPQPRQLEPQAFLEQYRQKLQLHDISSCKFVYDRLSMLLHTLNITDFDMYLSLIKISSLITLAANYEKGFVILLEPYDDLGISDPRILLSCVDASIAIQPVFNKYSSVVITSGTLSPMSLYPTMLNFTPYQSQQFTMSLNRNVVLPLIISKGGDQQPISTSYSLRESPHIVNNYGSLIVQLSKSIPDGIIVFFPSYAYMENILLSWNQTKIDPKTGKHKDTVISQILKHKLIFVETKDIEETTLALTAYKRACDNGRGAVFFSIARGKVSEGIDFSGHYGRCVVMVGVPYQFTRSRTLLARLEYLRTELQISEAEYLNFDALRQTSQCLGRIIRSKKDYGLMVLADARYSRADIRSKLPRWIQNFLKSGGLGTFSLGPGSNDIAPVTGGGINTSLSIDAAIGQVKGFLLSMATPHDIRFDYGTVLLNQVQAHQHLADLE